MKTLIPIIMLCLAGKADDSGITNIFFKTNGLIWNAKNYPDSKNFISQGIWIIPRFEIVTNKEEFKHSDNFLIAYAYGNAIKFEKGDHHYELINIYSNAVCDILYKDFSVTNQVVILERNLISTELREFHEVDNRPTRIYDNTNNYGTDSASQLQIQFLKNPPVPPVPQ